MNNQTLQYVADEEGNIQSVIVPIEMWRELESEHETAYLLKSGAMKQRLIEALNREETIPLKEVHERLGI